jgi:hypothetical protein
MKKSSKFVILLTIITLFISGCGNAQNDLSRAAVTVENYHRLYNEQKFEEIYNSAHEDAKANKSKEGLEFALAQSYEKLGKFLSSELVFSKVTPVDAKERQVELAYKSKFEKGELNETFLIVTNDEKGALHSIGKLSDEELDKLK